MDAKSYSWNAVVAIAGKYGLEPCLLDAVARVEGACSGFLPDGRPKILFEGHIFWRELKKAGLEPEYYASQAPDIVFPKWTKRFYKGGAGEYERLERAKAIHASAACRSASWGCFQVMGFNHNACGIASVEDFVAAMSCGFKEQLEVSVNFMISNKMLRYLQNQDWAMFAKYYNGPGYAQNKYDEKLKAAYEHCRREHSEFM